MGGGTRRVFAPRAAPGPDRMGWAAKMGRGLLAVGKVRGLSECGQNGGMNRCWGGAGGICPAQRRRHLGAGDFRGERGCGESVTLGLLLGVWGLDLEEVFLEGVLAGVAEFAEKFEGVGAAECALEVEELEVEFGVFFAVFLGEFAEVVCFAVEALAGAAFDLPAACSVASDGSGGDGDVEAAEDAGGDLFGRDSGFERAVGEGFESGMCGFELFDEREFHGILDSPATSGNILGEEIFSSSILSSRT